MGITVGAFYIPDGSFSNSRWPCWGGMGATKGERAGPQHTDPRLLAGSLPPIQENRTLVLGHMAFGQLGVGGTPFDPNPHPDTRHLCAWPGAPEGGDFAASQCPQYRVWHK